MTHIAKNVQVDLAQGQIWQHTWILDAPTGFESEVSEILAIGPRWVVLQDLNCESHEIILAMRVEEYLQKLVKFVRNR